MASGMQQPAAQHEAAKPQRGAVLHSQRKSPIVYVISGVSGSGKSTVGRMLAGRLQCPFHEGDDYHSQQARDKMHSGTPLTDEDRGPWLHALAAVIYERLQRKELAVVACSALKQRYRDILTGRESGSDLAEDIAFILLQPSQQELEQRLQQRAAAHTHFMPASLLQSQLALLEVDSSCMRYEAQTPAEIVDDIMKIRKSLSTSFQ